MKNFNPTNGVYKFQDDTFLATDLVRVDNQVIFTFRRLVDDIPTGDIQRLVVDSSIAYKWEKLKLKERYKSYMGVV
jgi:hypothetical protein